MGKRATKPKTKAAAAKTAPTTSSVAKPKRPKKPVVCKLVPRSTRANPAPALRRTQATHTQTASPTCCSFGPLRRVKYPSYFFCAECDNWDSFLAAGGGRANETEFVTEQMHSATHELVFSDRQSCRSTCFFTQAQEEGPGSSHFRNKSSTQSTRRTSISNSNK